MKRKIFVIFFLGLFLIFINSICVSADSYKVEYFDDPDIYVYCPPNIKEGELYPVLYLIHGKWQQPSIWEDIGLLDALNSLYNAGEIIPFFIVLPRDNAYLEDMYESDFYDKFLKKIMPFVEEKYPIDTSPVNTAIGGISRGAQWAQFIGFGEYGRFGSIGVHSPANAFYSFTNLYRIIRDHPEVPTVRVHIDIGDADNSIRIGSEFSQQLLELFYPHEFIIGVGGHNVEYWKKYLPDYLKWYSNGFSVAIKV